MFDHISWENPGFLYLLPVILPVMIWYWFMNFRNKAEIKISGLQNFKGLKKSYKLMFRHSLFALRLVAVTFLIIALARPAARLPR
jgi:Ca-activated chloride channel homolog